MTSFIALKRNFLNLLDALFGCLKEAYFKRNRIHPVIVSLLLTLLLGVLAPASGVWAGEGGGSNYTPGTRGDFAMALIGPEGWYVRNDLIYMDGDIGSVTLGAGIYTSAEQKVWVDTIKAIYLADSGVLGGRFGFVLSIPVVIDANASGSLAEPVEARREGSRWGVSDISATGILNWKSGDFNFSAGVGVFAPTGSYDADRMINLGRNYWSIDPSVAFTWLHPGRGHEVSFTAGYMMNTENNDTDYHTGDEFHFDFNLAQHFSSKFALGLDGYWYKQLTDDKGPFLDHANRVLAALGSKPLRGFKGESFGLGPALKYTAEIGSRDVNFIAKWLHDLDAKNRFKSDTLVFSIAFQF